MAATAKQMQAITWRALRRYVQAARRISANAQAGGEMLPHEAEQYRHYLYEIENAVTVISHQYETPTDE